MSIRSFAPLLAFIALAGLNACNNTTPVKQQATNPAPMVTPTDTAEHQTHKPHNHEASWHYDGDTGPEYWGDIKGNETCKIGHEQSPINITKAMISENKTPQIQFDVTNFQVDNNGHTIVYTPDTANNTTVFDGERYTLKQFHYHTPSEHQVSGSNYPAEIHFVHANAAGNLAVIGVMLNPTSATNRLGSLVDSSLMATQTGKSALLQNLDLEQLLPSSTSYYHYTGSLTTPPCSEKVQWYVATKPLEISSDDLIALSKLYSGNNRPVQSQGKRDVVYIK